MCSNENIEYVAEWERKSLECIFGITTLATECRQKNMVIDIHSTGHQQNCELIFMKVTKAKAFMKSETASQVCSLGD